MTLRVRRNAVLQGFFLLLPLMGACGKKGPALEAQGRHDFEAKDPIARTFRKIYPEAIGFFTLFDPEAGAGVWNSKVGLHGRYILLYKTSVSLDRSGRPRASGPSEFSLLQVASVKRDPDGTIRYKYRPEAQVDFGSDRWGFLALRGGDLQALGVNVGDEPPLPDFDLCWKAP